MLHTVEQVIEGLGGKKEVASLMHVSLPAVHNAIKRDKLPYRWRLIIIDEAHKRGLQIAPSLLKDMPLYPREGEAA